MPFVSDFDIRISDFCSVAVEDENPFPEEASYGKELYDLCRHIGHGPLA